jgi:enamine deaminase RidA (YjgF/YER057c/UK114 family)
LTERLAGDPPSPYELQYGFSRVLRTGQHVRVGGTTSVDEHGVVHGETPYEQAIAILTKIEHELGRAGAALHDVIETHVYVTDISRGAEVGRAHGEVFGSIKPLMTMIEVSGLIDPRMMVEIEALAYCP